MPNDFNDSRPLETLEFASARVDLSVEMRATARAYLLSVFSELNCKTADDVAAIGCTGLAHTGRVLKEIQDIAGLMAGSGVGLTCFVPDNKFCLAHNTIGGLMRGQAIMYADAVEKISRPLTAAEEVKVRLMDKVTNLDGTGSQRTRQAIRMLEGRDVKPDDLEVPGDPSAAVDAACAAVAATASETSALSHVREVAPNWVCTTHKRFTAHCRHCLAQAVIEGPLEPCLLLMPAYEGTTANAEDANIINPRELDEKIALLNENHFDAAALFVRVRRWTRRLAPDTNEV